MVLPIMVATTADARQVAIPVPDELVECLLGLFDEVTEFLHCLAAFGLQCTLLFLLFALAFLLSTLRLSPVLCGLLFGYDGGALVAANYLPVAHRVKPLTTFFVCALTAGFLSHDHPHVLLCQTRLGRGGLLLSGNRALMVQVI